MASNEASGKLSVDNGQLSAPQNGTSKADKKYGYEQTLMSGHYVTEDLADIARQIQMERLKQHQILTHKSREEIEKARIFEESLCYRCLSGCGFITRTIVNKIGEDWVFLFLLGTIMALLSFLMDTCILHLLKAHEVMFEEAGRIHPALQFLTWIGYPIILILFSTYFVHLVAPNAIGSGIPEMKTILRGVVLKEYLTFRTLLSKMVGLTTSLGSGLPFGKEGPFVHIASIVATLLSKWVSSFRGIFENESRNNEMLAAAAATGVACTFAAPIGGVLFSIEVTSTYFAVRNYWRGFFSAVIAAILFRLCAIWFEGEDTVTALYKTTLRHEFPFDAMELFAFAGIGVFSGLAGALFVFLHRKFIVLMRRNKKVSRFLQSYRFIYPLIVTLVITSATCPQTLGQYMGGGITFKRALSDFFANVTWSDKYNTILTIEEQNIIERWDNPSIWVSLPVYMIFVFLMSAVAITLPVPSGVFIPVFAMGAAFGRLVGEAMYVWFPNGINHEVFEVIPAGYAVVGAAALSGAVTHTISTSMIVFELTGQMSHILPAVLAVLIANAIANILQPSIYDSIIQIKRLPYLPNFLPTNSNAHKICAENIMLRDVKVISYDTTYEEVRSLLSQNEAIRSFPLVETSANMILLGSVQRVELIRLLEEHLGRERRQHLSSNGDLAAEVINEQLSNGGKKNGPYKKNKATSPRRRNASPAAKGGRAEVNSDDETDVRRGRGFEVLSERLKNQSDVYQTIGALVRPTIPSKSILKKSNTNPDLVNLAAESPSTTPLRSPSRSPHRSPKHGRISTPLTQLFKGRHRSSAEVLNQSDGEQSEHSTDSLLSLSNHDADGEDTVDGRVRFEIPSWRQMRWEAEQLSSKIDFEDCHIDPAPFQLVERTSLHKVHSLFSLLGLNHAYVTNVGRLVGVVSLKELRNAMSGPSIRDDVKSKAKQAKPGLLQRQTTMTSTVGGVNLQFDK